MSPAIYNSKVGQMLCCPITTKSKGYPLDVAFKAEKVAGVVLSDQIKSLGWKARNAALAGPVSDEVPA
jgi:mRNA interferase MazF